MTPFETKLAKIKERAENATPGPWFRGSYLGCSSEVFSRKVREIANCHSRNGIDSEFIAHARTDVPALLAVIEKLLEQRYRGTSGWATPADWRRWHNECDAELLKILDEVK